MLWQDIYQVDQEEIEPIGPEKLQRIPKTWFAKSGAEGGKQMTKIKDLHHDAMRLADEAAVAKREGKPAVARQRLKQAFDHERQAADLVAKDHTMEPTRSVLHRSAASLALECGALREAERLIAAGLSGDPPDEIAEELRDLLEQVYFGGKKGRRRLTEAANPP